ncbi:MAG: hypothetical protein NZ843_01340 [Fimbriimonadales bacterium]|nr:hypothetical protein [Fimbriimonadales bacterium]
MQRATTMYFWEKLLSWAIWLIEGLYWLFCHDKSVRSGEWNRESERKWRLWRERDQRDRAT